MAVSNRLGQRASGQTVQAIAATLPLDTASPNGLACALRFCVWDCLQESLDLVSRNGESFSCGDRGAVNPTAVPPDSPSRGVIASASPTLDAPPVLVTTGRF